MSVIKRVRLPPLDRDPTIKMLLARLNHDCYNALFKPRAFDEIWWTASSPDRRMIFHAPSDSMHHNWPRHLHIKLRVELSPTQKKEENPVGFIKSAK